MNKIKLYFDCVYGKDIYFEAKKEYVEFVIGAFIDDNDKYLFFDDAKQELLLLDEDEMKERYKINIYSDVKIDNPNEFMLFSSVSCLKMAGYNLCEIEKLLKERG